MQIMTPQRHAQSFPAQLQPVRNILLAQVLSPRRSSCLGILLLLISPDPTDTQTQEDIHSRRNSNDIHSMHMFPLLVSCHRRRRHAIYQNPLISALHFILHHHMIRRQRLVIESQSYKFTLTHQISRSFLRCLSSKHTILCPSKTTLQLQMPHLIPLAPHPMILGPTPGMRLLHNAHHLLAAHHLEANLFLLLFDDFEEGREGLAGGRGVGYQVGCAVGPGVAAFGDEALGFGGEEAGVDGEAGWREGCEGLRHGL
jgi:hypothetical protein